MSPRKPNTTRSLNSKRYSVQAVKERIRSIFNITWIRSLLSVNTVTSKPVGTVEPDFVEAGLILERVFGEGHSHFVEVGPNEYELQEGQCSDLQSLQLSMADTLLSGTTGR